MRLVEEAKREADSGDEDRSGLKDLIKEIAEREVSAHAYWLSVAFCDDGCFVLTTLRLWLHRLQFS